MACRIVIYCKIKSLEPLGDVLIVDVACRKVLHFQICNKHHPHQVTLLWECHFLLSCRQDAQSVYYIL